MMQNGPSRAARAVLVAAVLISGLTAGCSRGSGQTENPLSQGESPIRPVFTPEGQKDGAPNPATPATQGAGGPSTTTATGGVPTAVGTPPEGPSTTTSAPVEATSGTASPGAGPTAAPIALSSGVDDSFGDRTASVEASPAWSDLIGARLSRTEAGYELRVRVGGGSAPATAADADHSMNIATFFDVDGDGQLDYELWLNLADDGWYPGYFPPAGQGPNRFGKSSGVTVTTAGNEVVANLPSTHLGASTRFRWSVASEWGRFETLGTPAAARDDCPDADGVANFPG